MLVEASYVGISILSSSHAATSELLPETSLVDTRYRTDVEFTTHLAGRLGDVYVERAADLLGAAEPPPRATGYHVFRGHDRYLIDLLRRGPEAVATDAGWSRRRGSATSSPRFSFPTCRRSSTGPRPTTSSPGSGATSSRCTAGGAPATSPRSPRCFPGCSRAKTRDFVRRSLLRGEDFTNIGGIDLQFSHLIGYEPRFRIKA